MARYSKQRKSTQSKAKSKKVSKTKVAKFLALAKARKNQ